MECLPSLHDAAEVASQAAVAVKRLLSSGKANVVEEYDDGFKLDGNGDDSDVAEVTSQAAVALMPPLTIDRISDAAKVENLQCVSQIKCFKLQTFKLFERFKLSNFSNFQTSNFSNFEDVARLRFLCRTLNFHHPQ